MPANGSSITNDSLPSPASFYYVQCYDFSIGWYIYFSYVLTDIVLLLPLSVFVLHLGYQRWKQQYSVSSAAVLGLSDFITYNMAVMELIGIFGYIVSIFGASTNLPVMSSAGILIGVLPWYGQMIFPILSCAERYLAVVHPITYLRLRQVNRVRIRNISTVYVWLQSLAGVSILYLNFEYPQQCYLANACIMSLYLITITFYSLSVLCVLIRPRPGQAGGGNVRVDQSKQRAFHTILIIMGVLWLRFGGNLVCNVVGYSMESYTAKCLMAVVSTWFNLPSSLVLPLLFLHRAEKLPGWKHGTESG